MRIGLLILLLAVSLPLAAADRCDWRAVVLPADQGAVTTDIDTLLAMLPAATAKPDYRSDESQAEILRAADVAKMLLTDARSPQPLAGLAGPWQVRSIQVSADAVFDYPFFAARIERRGCGYRFVKSTGSQRRTGDLLPMSGDARQLAFVGTSTVNDGATGDYAPGNAPMGRSSSSDGPTNSVGRVMRLGPEELVMILDAGADSFDIYHLKR